MAQKLKPFNMKKQKPDPPKKHNIILTSEQFRDYVIDYESGKIDNEDILILMCYLSERLDDDLILRRFDYPYLEELIDAGVIVNGLVNPQTLKEYKNSKN